MVVNVLHSTGGDSQGASKVNKNPPQGGPHSSQDAVSRNQEKSRVYEKGKPIHTKSQNALFIYFPLYIDQIEVPNMKASAAAVKSIIGEVFADVSFEEFERGSSTVSLVHNR